MPKKLKPHDSFFKKALENPLVAQDFFAAHLPEKIKRLLDLNTLTIQKESFIEESLQKSFSDVLFTTKYQDKPAYLYLLAEHQSSSDHFMAFRLLKYMVNIWQRHLDQNKDTKTLPLIYPLVFYNGKEKYTAPTDLWSLFADAEMARSFLDNFQLVNVHEIPDSAMQKHVWSGILEFFMKHIFERDFIKVLENGKDIIATAFSISKEDTLLYLRTILYYNINKITEEKSDSLKQVLDQLTEHKGEEVMASLAHKWERDGIEKGKQAGILEGMLENSRVIARKMLKSNVPAQEIAKWTGLTTQEILSLKDIAQDK